MGRVFFMWLGMLLARPALGTVPDTLRLGAVNAGPWLPYISYCLDPCREAATAERAAVLWEAGRYQPAPPGRVLQLGYTQSRVWLRIAVRNTLPQRTRFVWSLYEFADSTVLFAQPNGRGLPQRVAGVSGRQTAARRAFQVRSLSVPFWLEAHAKAVLYLRVDNYTGAYYLSTDLTTTEDFLLYEANFFAAHHWAWLLGLYLGSALLNLVLYAFLRDHIHLWYGAYVVFGTWFLLMEDGLDALLLPQPVYALGWRLGQYSMLLLALAAGLRILSLFVRLRQGWPRLYWLNWGLSLVAATYVLGYGLGFDLVRQLGDGGLAWLNGGREVLLWGLLVAGVLVLATVGGRGRPAQRRLAQLYGLTYAFFFLGSVNFLLNRAGLVSLHLLEPNYLAWGLALELLTLSLLLTGRFRHALRQNADWRVRQLRERAAAGQRLIAAQDDEREALARELHDALAPGLTALHLAWQGRLVREALRQAPALLAEAHDHTKALLRQLRHDVRALSRALLPSPPGGEQPPLPEAMALLTETLNLTDDGPHVTGYCDPATADLPVPVQQAAYRIIAELLHNALRHAEARLVRVEARRLPASLRLTVQDDGQGFDPPAAARRGGLGLRGVQARAGYLRGHVLLSSQPGQGTVITVELPV